MSQLSKLTLGATSLLAIGTVVFVHFQQKAEQVLISAIPQAMHQGVVRDLEQQRVKRERQLDFDMQRALEAEYKKEQTVRSDSGGGGGSAADPAPDPR